jgi:hypothetical protein
MRATSAGQVVGARLPPGGVFREKETRMGLRFAYVPIESLGY